ncbi:hypothetical protein Ddc_14895 [Ditylenchus destructor]|nr:hypothetical protein Ddc_14895 [Ditylenchus destructor]
MSDWRRIVAMFVGCNLTVACLIVVMLDTMFIDRDVAVRNVLQSFNNSGIPSQSEVYDLLLAVHEKEPTMTGYQISRPITIVYLAALCTILSVYTNTTITMNLKIRQHFKQTRDWVHSSTERLQIMVYRAFVRTTLCLVIFNYLPFRINPELLRGNGGILRDFVSSSGINIEHNLDNWTLQTLSKATALQGNWQRNAR